MPHTSPPGTAPRTDQPTTDPVNATARFRDTLLAHEIVFLIAIARGRGNGLTNQLLSQTGLKVRHFAVLSLACSGKNPSQREMGEFLNLDPSQVVSLVDNLESRVLIRREADPRDRRSKILTATEAGHTLHDQAATLTRQAENQMLKHLTDEERAQLLNLLSKVVL